jgi:hypothetical protein
VRSPVGQQAGEDWLRRLFRSEASIIESSTLGNSYQVLVGIEHTEHGILPIVPVHQLKDHYCSLKKANWTAHT